MTILYILLVLGLTSIGFMLFTILSAPYGKEDEDGFTQYGE